MAERDDEREVGRLYRELPREEPPERLDEAIRAHARRAGATRPAPLVAPTGRRSWYYPVAAAAVLVLAVAVTWHVDRDEPDPAANGTVAEAKENNAQPKEERAPEVTTAQKQEAPQAKSDAAPRRRESAPKPVDQAARAPREPAAPPASSAAPPAPPVAPPPAGESAPARDAAGPLMSPRPMAESAEKRSMAKAQVAETPEQWLERIAKLRREGKHDEADKALAEFRRRYPDFTIPPAMLEQVEKK